MGVGDKVEGCQKCNLGNVLPRQMDTPSPGAQLSEAERYAKHQQQSDSRREKRCHEAALPFCTSSTPLRPICDHTGGGWDSLFRRHQHLLTTSTKVTNSNAATLQFRLHLHHPTSSTIYESMRAHRTLDSMIYTCTHKYDGVLGEVSVRMDLVVIFSVIACCSQNKP